MSPENWPYRYFTPEEFGDAAPAMSPVLLATLDDLRTFLGSPIVIHAEPMGADGRVDGSQHPLGLAVDCHAPGWRLLDFWLAAERFPALTGIGLYPYWERPGLHLDVRPEPRRARWWRTREGRYRAVDAVTLWDFLTSFASA